MQKEYLDLLKELISYRSVSTDIKQVNRAEDRMCDFLKSKGLFCTTEVIDGRHVVYASSMPGKVQDVLFNAHLDIVPAIYESQYVPEEKDGRLYARGTDDCLGCAVTIARFLAESKGKYSVSAFFTADEEIGGNTTAGMVKLGYGAKKAILVVDGGGYGTITYAQKGVISLNLKAVGRGGHSSIPWCFDNPLDKLIDGYVRLRNAWKNPTQEDSWKNSMAATIISGGSVHNQIPDEASMTVNIRYIADEDFDKIVNMVKELTGLEVTYNEVCPPVTVDRDAPALQTLAEAFRVADPVHPVKLVRMNGATDARHLKETGVPICIIGLEGGGCHSKCEWLDLESPEVFHRIFEKYLDLLSIR